MARWSRLEVPLLLICLSPTDIGWALTNLKNVRAPTGFLCLEDADNIPPRTVSTGPALICRRSLNHVKPLTSESFSDMHRPPDRCTMPPLHNAAPPAATATIISGPHSRVRDSSGEHLTHVPLENFLQTLESPATSSHLTGTWGAWEVGCSQVSLFPKLALAKG